MPIGDLAGALRQRHALGGPARIAQRDRAIVVGERRADHVHEHRLVAGRHHDDVRQAAEVGDVEGAVVGRTVVADEPGAVHREDDVQLLQADVVDDLVVGALEEGRVDRADRLRALERQARREQNRVLLGDADVVVLLRDLLGELLEPGPPGHRGGDPDHALVALGLGDERVGEDARVLGRGRAAAASRASRARSSRGRRTPSRGSGFFGAGLRSTIEPGFAACHFSIPSRPPSSAGAKPLPLTVWMWTTTGRSASSASPSAAPQRARRRGRR